MRPGMSATLTRSRSRPRCSVPRCGLSVVNGYAATSVRVRIRVRVRVWVRVRVRVRVGVGVKRAPPVCREAAR